MNSLILSNLLKVFRLIAISKAVLTQSFFFNVIKHDVNSAYISICMSVMSCIFSVQVKPCFDKVPFHLLRTVYQHLVSPSHLENSFLLDTVS